MARAEHLDWLLGELWRLHAIHRLAARVAVGHRPRAEGVQAPVAVVGARRLPAGRLIGDQHPGALALEVVAEQWLVVGLAVGGEQPAGSV